MNCLQCDGEMQCRDSVDLTGEYRGARITVRMPGLICKDCGYATIRGRDSGEFGRLLREQYRELEGVTKPDDLRAARREMNVSQKGLAEFLKVGAATVKRVEAGSVPEKLLDTYFKIKLHPEEMESLLQESFWNLSSAKGTLAELPDVSAQFEFVWNNTSPQWTTCTDRARQTFILDANLFARLFTGHSAQTEQITRFVEYSSSQIKVSGSCNGEPSELAA